MEMLQTSESRLCCSFTVLTDINAKKGVYARPKDFMVCFCFFCQVSLFLQLPGCSFLWRWNANCGLTRIWRTQRQTCPCSNSNFFQLKLRDRIQLGAKPEVCVYEFFLIYLHLIIINLFLTFKKKCRYTGTWHIHHQCKHSRNNSESHPGAVCRLITFFLHPKLELERPTSNIKHPTFIWSKE